MFLEMLGAGITLYNILDRDLHSQGSSDHGISPSDTGNKSVPGRGYRPCTTAQGRPGFIDDRGLCQHDDTARAR